ncbi:MAG: hypothetical protein VX632_05530, partial [Chloroflexota bacterium]|nr:hypothetical protein [Chloroflexota bacterium]
NNEIPYVSVMLPGNIRTSRIMVRVLGDRVPAHLGETLAKESLELDVVTRDNLVNSIRVLYQKVN